MAIPSAVKKNVGTSGLADVRVLANALRVIFKEDGYTVDVPKNGWERQTGLYNITLNKGDDEIKYVSPPGRDEPYLVRFNEFGNRVGRDDDNPGVPEPKMKPGGTYPGKNGGTYSVPDKLVLSAKLVVVEDGPYLGMTIPYELPYIFEQYQGTSLAMFRGRQAENNRWEDFLRAAGVDLLNAEIPWSSNVAPYIEGLLQSHDAIFSVQLNERGFVAKDGLRAVPSYLIDPERLGAGYGKPAKKAPAKKKAASKKK